MELFGYKFTMDESFSNSFKRHPLAVFLEGEENAEFVTRIKYKENSFFDVLDQLKLGEPRYSDF